MSRGIRTAGSSCAIVLALSWAASADTVEEVQKKIIEAGKKVKSSTADVTMAMDMTNEQMTMKMNGTGTMKYMVKGEKFFSRQEMKMNTEMTGMPAMEQSVLTVTDGAFTYTLSEQMGMKTAMKAKIDPKANGVASDQMFETLNNSYTLKLLPDASVDGRSTYVIEATPKQAQQPEGKSIYYFGKQSGMMLKMVVHTPDAKPMTTMTVTNVRMNVDIAADQFKFTAPDGVVVQDMTGR